MLNCDSISGRFTLLSSPAHITAGKVVPTLHAATSLTILLLKRYDY